MKNFTKKLLAFALMLVFLLSMAACGDSGEGGKDAEQGTTVNEPASDDTADKTEAADGQTVYPLKVTDANGKEVIIEKEPEKIISISPTLTEMVYALGGGDKVVGRSDYCDYPDEVLQVDSVGNIQTADSEMILSKNPDLILVSGMTDETFLEKLTSLNVTVLLVEEVGTMDKVYEVMNMMGMILNENELTASRIEEMKKTISEVTEKVKGLDTPKVYYVVDFGEYGDYTVGGTTFIHELLTMAGGDNIAKDIDGWEYSLEKIIENDPDIIIVPPYYKDTFPTAPHYSELRAVKEGQVYSLDTNMMDRQGYRNAQAVLELAQIFHPEAFE